MSILDTEYTYSVKLYDPSPHRCLALGYCIANSSCGWKLELRECSDGTQAEMILQGLKESRACHTSYSIKSIQCDSCSTDFTHKLFSQIPDSFIARMERLSTVKCDFGDLQIMRFHKDGLHTISGTPKYMSFLTCHSNS